MARDTLDRIKMSSEVEELNRLRYLAALVIFSSSHGFLQSPWTYLDSPLNVIERQEEFL